MKHANTTGLRVTRIAVVFLSLLLVAFWIVRPQITNSFNHVLGDVYDNTIEIAILEHWYNVLRGLEAWSNTNYFFPHANTLGYNDGYFLYGLIYAIARFLDADPYLAAFIVHLLVRLAGFAFFLLFANRVLKIPFTFALAGAGIFTLSNNLAIHALHAQLLSVALVPLCAWLLYRSGEALSSNQEGRLFIYGTAFALIYAAWAMTAFYTLWFFTFFFACLTVWVALRHREELRSRLEAVNKRTLLTLAAVFGILLLSLVPFLQLYLPKASETGMHGFGWVELYLPSPYDILNIGLGNYMYSSVVEFLHKTIGFPADFNEKQMGLTPGVVLLFLIFSVQLGKSKNKSMAADVQARGRIETIAIVTIITYFLSLEVSGQSAWHLVYFLFPGAKAVRVVSRYYIFLTVPIICVGMYGLSTLRFRGAYMAGVVICIFLIYEQSNWVWSTENLASSMAIDRVAATTRLKSAKPVPAGCQAFFVLVGRKAADGNTADPVYWHNIEAMLLSEYLHLPTINGFSTFNPPDWKFDHPQKSDYLARVRTYEREHNIGALCSLDLQTMKWNTDPI